MKTIYRTLFFGMVMCAAVPLSAANLSLGVMTGYKGGLGFSGSATLDGFARGFPLGLELTLSHVRMDPGSPEQARRIFINDATDGTPEKTGYAWDVEMDFLYRVHLLELRDAFVYAGVRRSMFTANFRFIGGNEFFDIQTEQWGVAAGMKASFPMAGKVAFLVKLGVEHHFASALYGHDTSYGPNGEIISGRKNYTYADADAAINQPTFNVVGMLGLSFGL